MSLFSKTVIVDSDHIEEQGKYYQTIEKAAKYFRDNEIGGVIIVESGTYIIDGTGYKTTVLIPKNVTIIGRGNVIVKVTDENQIAFRNADWVNGNERITISGFKIIVECNTIPYNKHLVDFRNVKNCIIEKLTITCTGTQGIYQYIKKNDQDPTREDQWAAIL